MARQVINDANLMNIIRRAKAGEFKVHILDTDKKKKKEKKGKTKSEK